MEIYSMKPDFDTMTKAELKAYVFAHKNDTEAFHKLADRLNADNQNSPWQPYPQTPEDLLKMETTLQEKVRSIGQ